MLVFGVKDVGDGIYDSQVLISGVTVGSLQVIDPFPDFLSLDGLVQDANRLAKGGKPARGAAADGVSRLLLRTIPGSGATSVRFTLAGASLSADGGLTSIHGGSPVGEITVPVISTTDGPRAYALYLAPADFAKAGYEDWAERTVTLRTTIVSGGTERSSDTALIIARPPVLLIHGFWLGSADSWAGSPLLTDSRFSDRIVRMDWSDANVWLRCLSLRA